MTAGSLDEAYVDLTDYLNAHARARRYHCMCPPTCPLALAPHERDCLAASTPWAHRALTGQKDASVLDDCGVGATGDSVATGSDGNGVRTDAAAQGVAPSCAVLPSESSAESTGQPAAAGTGSSHIETTASTAGRASGDIPLFDDDDSDVQGVHDPLRAAQVGCVMAAAVVHELRWRVLARTRLTCSAGIGPNPMIAKVGDPPKTRCPRLHLHDPVCSCT